MNRLFVGSATAVSSDYVGSPSKPTTPGWLDTLFDTAMVGSAQFASGAALGTIAILGYTRVTDFTGIAGAASSGSQGGVFIAYNDDLTFTGSIACALLAIGVQKTGGTGQNTLALQLDINATTLVDIDQNSNGGIGGVNGETIGALITSGVYTNAYITLSTAKPSAAIALGYGGSFPFRKAIVVPWKSLDTTVGAGGGGLFAELPRGASLRWKSQTPTTDAEIWGDANGFRIGSTAMSLNAALPLVNASFGIFTLGGSSGSIASFQVNAAETFRIQVVSNNAQFVGFGASTIFSLTTNSGSNVNVTMYPSGGVYVGQSSADPGLNNLQIQGALLHPTTANGSVATAMASVGPTGSHTGPQEWFPIKNAAGTVRYVPGF